MTRQFDFIVGPQTDTLPAISTVASPITADCSTGDLTVAVGESFLKANLIIKASDTYTINGSLEIIDTLTIDGTLIVGATGVARVV